MRAIGGGVGGRLGLKVCMWLFCVRRGMIANHEGYNMAVSRSCIYCAKRFTAKMERRLFCSDACRARYNRENNLTCFYCCCVSDTVEHITPQTVFRFGNKETVKACRDCNSTCGADAPFDLIERIDLLIERTVRKYKLNQAIPEWDDAELLELGKNLHQYVKVKIMARQRAIERVLAMQMLCKQLRQNFGH